MGFDGVQFQQWNAWVKVVRKAIRHVVFQSLYGVDVAIKVDVAKATIRSKVVNTAHMVVMYVGK